MKTTAYYSVEAPHFYHRSRIRSEHTTLAEPVEETINHEAFHQMAEGQLPDLREFCLALAGIMHSARAPESAEDLLPFLDSLPELDEPAIKALQKLSATRFVLISGERFELVLNHWKPGKATDIHGHPSGGCIFKLLYGKVEEVRYTPAPGNKFLGFVSHKTGDLGNIDNGAAYHQVGNPYGRSAVSIHIYLKKSI